jgi:hypothetical protein
MFYFGGAPLLTLRMRKPAPAGIIFHQPGGGGTGKARGDKFLALSESFFSKTPFFSYARL